MTPEITRIRAALAAYQAATTLAETLDAVGEVEDACSADVMPAVLAHIDAMQARIDTLHAEIAKVWQPKHDAMQAEIERLKTEIHQHECNSFNPAIDAAIRDTP